MSLATEEVPRLAEHRFSVIASSEAKSKKSVALSSEKAIFAHEVSLGSATTKQRNNLNLDFKHVHPLQLMIELNDFQQLAASTASK